MPPEDAAENKELVDVLEVCSSSQGIAQPALRIGAFLDAFPDENQERGSICQEDFSDTMNDIGIALERKLSDPCFRGIQAKDTDLETDGVQPLCTVVDKDVSTKQPLGRPFPNCDVAASDESCWTYDDSICVPPGETAPDGFSVKVDRKGTQPAAGTIEEVACAICLTPDTPGCGN